MLAVFAMVVEWACAGEGASVLAVRIGVAQCGGGLAGSFVLCRSCLFFFLFGRTPGYLFEKAVLSLFEGLWVQDSSVDLLYHI